MKRKLLFAMILCCGSCALSEPPEKRISNAAFADRPSVIRQLEIDGKISPEVAKMYQNRWEQEAREIRQKQEAFDRWYRTLSPAEQVAYEQSRMQALAAGMQAMSLNNAMLQRNINDQMNRNSYDRRTDALLTPQYHNHNIQGTLRVEYE